MLAGSLNNESQVIKLKDGRKLGYALYGDPNGKPLCYFHGWPSGRLMAAETDIAAKKLGVSVISIDRPGYGLSDYQEERTLLDWPNDVLELADKLKINKFAVIGISGGGPYAAVCAYKIPEKLTGVGIVVGLAPTYIPQMLDGLPWFTKAIWASYARFPIIAKAASILLYLNAKYSPGLGLFSFYFRSKYDRQILSNANIRQRVRRSVKDAFRMGYKGAEWDLKLFTTDWKFNLKDIKATVYLWYGSDDKNVSLAMGKYYASQIPNHKLTIYPNEGHLCRINHVEEIIETLTT